MRVNDDNEVRLMFHRALAGDPRHPFTRGTLCAKVDRYLDRVYGPERVLHPLRRAGAKGDVAEKPPLLAPPPVGIGL